MKNYLFVAQGESSNSLNISGNTNNSFDKVSFINSYSSIGIWKLSSYALPVAFVISFLSVGIALLMLI